MGGVCGFLYMDSALRGHGKNAVHDLEPGGGPTARTHNGHSAPTKVHH